MNSMHLSGSLRNQKNKIINYQIANMPLVFQTENFTIVAPDTPHVSRTDGGHIVIGPVVTVEDRTQLSPRLAKEMMKLTMVAGEAMKTVLARHGIDVGRINYQDNGNWKHSLHIHLYGRAKGAVVQKYGTALQFPATPQAFKEMMGNLEPLTEGDCNEIRKEIERLLETEKYKHF